MAKLLITAKEIIDRAIPDANFDEAYLKDRYIESAQLNYIRPILGDDFYDLVIAAPSSYSALTPYIKDCLAFYVLVEALPLIHTHLTSRGVVSNSTDYTASAGRDLRSDMQKALIGWGDEYKDKMVRYLEDNTATYTSYANQVKGTLLGGILM